MLAGDERSEACKFVSDVLLAGGDAVLPMPCRAVLFSALPGGGTIPRTSSTAWLWPSSSAGDDGTDAAAKKQSYPEPDYPRNEWIDDENWAAFQRLSKVRGTNIVHTAVNNCHTGAVKRALMEEGGMDMVNSLEKNEYSHPPGRHEGRAGRGR